MNLLCAVGWHRWDHMERWGYLGFVHVCGCCGARKVAL